jgi:hypothetical protein
MKSEICRKLCVLTAAVVLGVTAVGVQRSIAAEDKKDSDIAVAMKKAFKGTKSKPALIKKAQDGTASKEELASLLEYVKQMQKAKPPIGDAKDWDTRTAALVGAAEKVMAADKGGVEALKSAANCKECHKLHKEE